jgi:VWFA-related protein
MRCTWFFSTVLVLSVWFPVSVRPSYSQEAGRPGFTASVDEILLDAIVRDKKGRPVEDLSKADFTVYEDGVALPLRGFRLVRGGETLVPDVPGMKLDPFHQLRLITLVFGRMDTDGRRMARTAASEFLKQDLPANSYLAIFVLDSRLDVVQPFTRDRELLNKAVHQATDGAYGEYASSSKNISDQLERLLGPNKAERTPEERVNELKGPEQAMMRILLNMVRFDERAELTQTSRDSIFGLFAAVRGQAELPGRKALLYFCNGFAIPHDLEDTFRSLIDAANRVNASFYAFDASGLSSDRANDKANKALAAAAQAALETSSSGAPVASGASPNSVHTFERAEDSGRQSTQDMLLRLSSETGGFLTANTNDFRKPAERILEEIETYYELSYRRPAGPYDGRFRKVEVKVARAGLRVQSRSGYLALPPSVAGAGPIESYELPLMQALAMERNLDAFSFQSRAMAFQTASGQPVCELVIEVPFRAVSISQGGDGVAKGGLAWVAIVRNAEGEVVTHLKGDLPIRIAVSQIPALREGEYTKTEHFELPPGPYSVATAVLDRVSDEISIRRYAFVIQPPSHGLSLSDAVLVRSWHPKNADGARNNPMLFDQRIITPTLASTLSKSDWNSLPFYVAVYSSAGNPQLKVELRQGGQLIQIDAAITAVSDESGRFQYLATVPIEALFPGRYEVTFVATREDETVRRTLVLTLAP